MEPGTSGARPVMSGQHPQASLLEARARLTTGRSPENHLVLDDQRASRRHAEIRHDGRGGYSILDTGSANGTWVNGRMLSAPRRLATGDVIAIGNLKVRFLAPEIDRSPVETAGPAPQAATDLSFRYETVIVLGTDIRNYTSMSEALPNRELSLLIASWFKEAGGVIEARGGTVDKFIGDAVMAYWLVREPERPDGEVNEALRSARELMRSAR